MDDAYQAGLDFLFDRLNYERIEMPLVREHLWLGRIRRLMKRLGDPQDGLRIVHVAGTKGKGSSAAMMAAALSASGVRTGLFSSPHLHRLEERFQIDGIEATSQEIVALIEAVRPAVERADAESAAAGWRGTTFFEVLTAMGLLHFARRGVGAVLLEVGLGGRLDSTNCVRPMLALLTSISLDHTRQLGKTLGAIAGEKAGILKRGTPAVSGVVGAEATEVIRRVARQRRSALREVGRDYRFTYHPPTFPLDRPTAGRVSVSTWRTDWGTLPLPLLGAHQAGNTALVLAGLDALAEQGMVVDRAAVERGFASLSWPARLEILGRNPWIVVDGAHNVAAAEALAAALGDCFPPGPRTLIFGTSRDKDLPGQLRALVPLVQTVVATRFVGNPRAVPPAEAAAAARALGARAVATTEDPASALDAARSATPTDGLIIVTGSLFLAGEARSLLLEGCGATGIMAVPESTFHRISS